MGRFIFGLLLAVWALPSLAQGSGQRYPNGQLVFEYNTTFHYPTGAVVNDYNKYIHYPNSQVVRDYNNFFHYPNGVIVRDYNGYLHYPSGRLIKDSEGNCFYENGVKMGRCPEHLRVRVADEAFGKMTLTVSLTNKKPLSTATIETATNDGETLIYDVDLNVGTIDNIGLVSP